MINSAVLPQHRFGNSGDLIEIVGAGIDHCQFHVPLVLRIILGITALESHVALDRKQIGKKSAREHDDQSGMSQMDAELAPAPTKSLQMRHHEIDQQHRPNEMPTRKDWNLEPASLRRPPHKDALEIALLRFVNAEMNLRKRAGKNKRHPGRQTN